MQLSRFCQAAILSSTILVIPPSSLHAAQEPGSAAAAGAPAQGMAQAPHQVDLKAIGGTQRWRTLIAGGRNRLPDHERLIVVSGAGEVVRRRDGDVGGVSVPPEWMPLLRDHAAEVTLAHNHPGGQSLSRDDLAQFEKPAVAIILAVGHDGSFYAAAAGRMYDSATFAGAYAAASSEIERLLRLRAPGSASALHLHRNHLVALALAQSHVILYRAELAQDRREAFTSCGLLFGDLVRGAAAWVRGRPVGQIGAGR